MLLKCSTGREGKEWDGGEGVILVDEKKELEVGEVMEVDGGGEQGYGSDCERL